jgi:hypothetical protein
MPSQPEFTRFSLPGFTLPLNFAPYPPHKGQLKTLTGFHTLDFVGQEYGGTLFSTALSTADIYQTRIAYILAVSTTHRTVN